MATSTILLWPGAITLPDGSAGNLFATAQLTQSSGAAPVNGPKVHFDELVFPTLLDTFVIFSFRMPVDYVSDPVVKIQHRATISGASGIRWLSCLAAVTPGVAETPGTKSYPVPQEQIKIVGSVNDELQETSIALAGAALDSVVAGDWVSLLVGRDDSDTVNVSVKVLAVSLEYTAA